MSTYRKVLKVLSIVSLVLSIIGILMGVGIVFLCGTNPDGALQAISVNPIGSMSATDTLYVVLGVGIFLAIYCVWEVFVSIMGIRGANNPRKMGFVTVMAAISFAIGALGFVAGVAGGNFSVSGLCALVLSGAFLYVCYKVREEGKNSGML